MCGAGEAAGQQSAADHTQNRLFSAEKEDTLRSAVGQLKYSGGNESNTQDEYFFLTKTRRGLAVGAAKSERKRWRACGCTRRWAGKQLPRAAGLQGRETQVNQKSAQRKCPAAARTKIIWRGCLETSPWRTPDSPRRRLHSVQCLLSTSEKKAASLHVFKWE